VSLECIDPWRESKRLDSREALELEQIFLCPLVGYCETLSEGAMWSKLSFRRASLLLCWGTRAKGGRGGDVYFPLPVIVSLQRWLQPFVLNLYRCTYSHIKRYSLFLPFFLNLGYFMMGTNH
jgi:hypothetical protein